MVVIIGAGISGLTAARLLEKDYLLLEKEDYVGGLSTQYADGGRLFDYGGHYFHFKDKEDIRDYLSGVSPFLSYKRKSQVFIRDRFIPFPIQFHLSFLPKKLKEAIVPEILAAGTGEAANLRDYLRSVFGPTLFEAFFEPFLSKYYNHDLGQMAARMDKGSIPVPDKRIVAEGARGKRFLDAGYNPLFYYPRLGLKSFMEAFSRDFPQEKRLHLREPVLKIDIEKKTVTTGLGTYRYDYLINTMPLDRFLGILVQREGFPGRRKLRHISTLVCNVVLKKKRKRFHWLYLPERQFPFYRAGFYPAQGESVAYLERTVTRPTPPDKSELLPGVSFTLKKLGMIEDEGEILFLSTRVIPVSYIIFDLYWQDTVPGILKKLEEQGIYSIGRYGAWTYTSMSDDVKTAMETARMIDTLP